MEYALYHKNVPVFTCVFDIENGIFGKIININSKEHIPVGILELSEFYPKKTFEANLTDWWKSRTISKDRLKKYNIKNIEVLNRLNYGFNLSDQYWIKDSDSDMTWEKGNFFTNDFDEDFGKYLIPNSKMSNFQIFNSQTPDLFINGEQDKRWIIENETRVLLKYGRLSFYQEPFNERLASELCKRLEMPYVSYSIKVLKKNPYTVYSACPCCVNENEEYIPAGFVQYILKKDKNESAYDHLIKCCKNLNMPNIDEIEKYFSKMVLLDYIIANTDRHYGNFGFIRDANTLKWLRVMPNFDMGNSMFFEKSTEDLEKSTSLMENVKCKSFASSQTEQLKRFSKKIAKLNVDFSKLNGIESYFKRILSLQQSGKEKRTELLCNLLRIRIKNAQEIILTKNEITQQFLNEIKKIKTSNFEENLSNIIKISYKNICKNDSDKKEIINKFIKSLNPKSEEELVQKIIKLAKIDKMIDLNLKNECKQNKTLKKSDDYDIECKFSSQN